MQSVLTKISHYNPGQMHGISTQSVHKVGNFFSPTHQQALPPGNIPVNILEAESTAGPQCSCKDYVNENSNYTIGNRTRDLPTCRAVLRSNARHGALLSNICRTRLPLSAVSFIMETLKLIAFLILYRDCLFLCVRYIYTVNLIMYYYSIE